MVKIWIDGGERVCIINDVESYSKFDELMGRSCSDVEFDFMSDFEYEGEDVGDSDIVGIEVVDMSFDEYVKRLKKVIWDLDF